MHVTRPLRVYLDANKYCDGRMLATSNASFARFARRFDVLKSCVKSTSARPLWLVEEQKFDRPGEAWTTSCHMARQHCIGLGKERLPNLVWHEFTYGKSSVAS